MSKIKNRTSLTVAHTFQNGNYVWQQNLQVGFEADEVIVRQITYGLATADTKVSVIQSDLVRFGDGILGHVFPNTVASAGINNTQIASSVTPNSIFIVNQSKINGGQTTFKFLAWDLTSSSYIQNTTADGQVTLTLEFIKYDK